MLTVFFFYILTPNKSIQQQSMVIFGIWISIYSCFAENTGGSVERVQEDETSESWITHPGYFSLVVAVAAVFLGEGLWLSFHFSSVSLQNSPNYHAEKQRCEYLHNKLAHIKRLIADFDQRRAQSWFWEPGMWHLH